MYDPDLRRELVLHVNKRSSRLSASMVRCTLREDCRIVISALYDDRKQVINGWVKRHIVELPCRVPETNCFPSEKMLAFMGQAPLPTKKAKPRDWIAIIDKALEEHFSEYKEES